MIPRLKPYLGKEEISALFTKKQGAVGQFETEFAAEFDCKYAISFPYGRSAIWAFLKALNLEGAEVIQPAYTCSVVAHATYLSGNIPIFVDCKLSDYNMDLDLLVKAITPKTRVVIPTHLFGYPMDVDTVNEIIQQTEKRYGQKIWVLQDCAHSFDARFKEKSVINAGDGTIFGLNISKQITSIFGGMFTTNDEALAEIVRSYRDSHFTQTGWVKRIKRTLYFLSAYPAFNSTLYGLVYWLENKTSLLNGLTKAYHLDEKIHFPPDYFDLLSDIEALVGSTQIRKYKHITKRRKAIAASYFDALSSTPEFILPPQIEGATFSHFVVRTRDKDRLMQSFAEEGIQVGQLIEYSMPHHPAYRSFRKEKDFPNSKLCSQSMINLPIHPGLSNVEVAKIIRAAAKFIK